MQNLDLVRKRAKIRDLRLETIAETKAERQVLQKYAELESNPEYRKVFAYYSKKADAEKALKVAQEYYIRTLKPMERTEA